MLGILVIIVIWSAMCVYIYISPGTIVQDVHEYRCLNHGCTYLLEYKRFLQQIFIKCDLG